MMRRVVRPSAARSLASCLGATLLLGCASVGPPVVEQRSFGPAQAALARVVVAPFAGERSLVKGAVPGVGLVERFVTEEMERRGIEVIPAGDLKTALTAAGGSLDPASLLSAVRVAARDFGATGLLVGRVTRYRERLGQELGATRPASVAFEITLHEAPGGRRLWRGRFDETQVALSDAPVRARRYPGGGLRWLSAQTLARWGAENAAAALVDAR